MYFFSTVNFFKFLVIRTLDPDPDWTRILDPDPESETLPSKQFTGEKRERAVLQEEMDERISTADVESPTSGCLRLSPGRESGREPVDVEVKVTNKSQRGKCNEGGYL
jgi:hypothetical protein